MKYYIQSETVYSFCKLNALNYKSVLNSINYYLKKNDSNDISIKSIIEKVLKKYLLARNNKIILEQSHLLKKNIPIFSNEMKNICYYLNISCKNVTYISKKGYDMRSTIILIHYYSKQVNKKGNRIIKAREFDRLMKKFKKEEQKDIKIAILMFLANLTKDKQGVFDLLYNDVIIPKANKFVFLLNLPYHCLNDVINDIAIDIWKLIGRLLPYEKEQIYKFVHIFLNFKKHEIYDRYQIKDISLFSKFCNGEKELIDFIH